VQAFCTPTGGSLGANLITDGNGEISGVYVIPDPNVAGNPKFKTGERVFRLTSSPTNQQIPQPETFAQAIFSSTGILRNIQEEIIATRNGRIETQRVSDSRTVSSSRSANESRTQLIAVQNIEDDDEGNSDPLAQTFKASAVGGEMVTKIDVFFQRKDKDIPVLCQIREVVNGFPTIKQLPFAGKHLSPYLKGTVSMNSGSTSVEGSGTDFLTGTHNMKVGDTITISGAGNTVSGVTPDTNNYDANALVTKITAINSNDGANAITVADAAVRPVSNVKISNVNIDSTATQPTTFRFDSPVYIKDEVEYAIVLFTPCESYFAWISRMGELDIGGTRMISKQPHLGVLFKSQNNTTWNSYQYEDLKFTVYRASFTAGSSGKVTLNNDVVPNQKLPVDPIRTITGEQFVQINHPNNHMHSPSNNVTISGISSGITTTLSGAITSTTQTAITINANADFVASNDGSNIYIKIGDEKIVGTISGTTITASTRGYDSSTAVTHLSGATVELYQINGIPLDQINKTHTAIANNRIDSYTVPTSTAATSSSNQGGTAVVATENAQMDGVQTLLPTVTFPDTTLASSIRTTSATSPSGTETSFNLQGTTFAKSVTIGENFFFDKPQMVASQINETNEISGQKSFYLDVDLATSKENLSPIVDLDRKSIVAFTNRLDNIDSASDMGVTALQGDFVSSEAASGDSNEAIYITRRVSLDNPATGIKVILDMNRFASADVKLMFKILRSDDASDFDEIGYNFFNTSGGPDTTVNASLTSDDFKEYEYTANNLDEFIAFSIKIVMQGTNSSEPPRLKDLRAIALAT